MENFAKSFFDVVTTHHDEICYVKHVLPRGLGHNLLMQFCSLGNSRMEFSESDSFDTLTMQNDQVCYAKHVLAPLDVFFRCPWLRDAVAALPQLGPPDQWPACLRRAGLFPLRLAQGLERELLDEFLYRMYGMYLRSSPPTWPRAAGTRRATGTPCSRTSHGRGPATPFP